MSQTVIITIFLYTKSEEKIEYLFLHSGIPAHGPPRCIRHRVVLIGDMHVRNLRDSQRWLFSSPDVEHVQAMRRHMVPPAASRVHPTPEGICGDSRARGLGAFLVCWIGRLLRAKEVGENVLQRLFENWEARADDARVGFDDTPDYSWDGSASRVFDLVIGRFRECGGADDANDADAILWSVRIYMNEGGLRKD